MNQSISLAEAIMKLKSNSNQSRSPAEDFIDSIVRPYNLSDARAVALFENVKRSVRGTVKLPDVRDI